MEDTREHVDFKVIFNKQKYDVSFPLDDTVTQLKNHLEKITRRCISYCIDSTLGSCGILTLKVLVTTIDAQWEGM